MSFFGFDTSLPRDKSQANPSKGIFEHQDPFAGIAQARKLQAFQDDEPEEFVLLFMMYPAFADMDVPSDSILRTPTMG